MNRLLVIILILLGLESQAGAAATKYSITRANLIYYRLVRYFFIALVIIALGFVCNIIELKGVNLLFSIIFTIVAIIFATRPINLAVIAGLGAVIETLKEDASLTIGAEKFLRYYYSAFLYVLLYGSIILYFLGTLSFRENPWAFVGITASVMLLLLISTAWNFGLKMSKKIIFLYACTMLVLYTFSLVPRATWIKITGYDLKTLASLSETETTLSEVEQTERRAEEKGAVKKLKKIQGKIERGVVLSQEEKTFLAEQKNKRDGDAFLNKIIGRAEIGVEKAVFIEPPIKVYGPGCYKFILHSGQESNWIKIPPDMYWELSTDKEGDFYLIPFDGDVFTFSRIKKEYVDFPDQNILFKINAKEDLVFTLVVSSKN